MKKRVSGKKVIGWIQFGIGVLILAAGIIGIILINNSMSSNVSGIYQGMVSNYQYLNQIRGNMTNGTVFVSAQAIQNLGENIYLFQSIFIAQLIGIILGMILGLLFITQGLGKVLNWENKDEKKR